MPTLASTFALTAALMAAAPQDPPLVSARSAAEARIEADLWDRFETARNAPEQDQSGPPRPPADLTGRYGSFSTAAPAGPDPAAIQALCMNGEAFESEALPACIDRITAREQAAMIQAQRLGDACRTRPRLPGETVEACIERRSAAEQATRAAHVPLAPQAPLPAAWPEPRPQQRCERQTYRQEGGGGVTFTCTTGDDSEASRAAQDMLRDMMRRD